MRQTPDRELTFKEGVLPGRQRRPFPKRALQIGAVLILPLLSAFNYLVPFLKVPQIDLASWFSAKDRLYEDDPVYKGPKDPPSTLESLDLKHRDSHPCLDLVLKLRDSKVPKDLEIACSCLDRALQNESPTASDEVLSHLYSLRGDLFTRQGESAKAILDLETASKLNPDNFETAILLLRAYKEEEQKLRAPSPPWSLDLQRRIDALGDKINALEKGMRGRKLSLFEDASASIDTDRRSVSHLHFEVSSGRLWPSTGACGLGCSVHVGTRGTSSYAHLHGRLSPSATFSGGTIYALGNFRNSPSTIISLNGCSYIGFGITGAGKSSPTFCGVRNLGASDSPAIAVTSNANWTESAIRWLKVQGIIPANIGSTRGVNRAEFATLARSLIQDIPGSGDAVLANSDRCPAGCTGDFDSGMFTRSTLAPVSLSPSLAVTAWSSTNDVGNTLGLWVKDDFTPVEEVLAVGVNGDGTAGLRRLKYAAADAQRVSASLRDLDFHSTVLTNTAATRPKILAELSRVVQASRPGDTLVFYFSGHGFADVNGHPILVTGGNTAIDGSSPTGGGTLTDGALEMLSLEEITDVLSFHRGRAVVILDNCLTAMQLDSGTPRRTVAGPNRPAIILAGASGGRVIESPRLGSGLFTYTLLRFLEQQRTSELDFDAMFRYTAAETARLASDLYGVSQRPQWLLVR